MSREVRPGTRLARATLVLLAAGYAALPSVPGLLPASRRLDAAALVLAATYLYLSYDSVRQPRRAFWAGFTLLAVVTVGAV